MDKREQTKRERETFYLLDEYKRIKRNVYIIVNRDKNEIKDIYYKDKECMLDKRRKISVL